MPQTRSITFRRSQIIWLIAVVATAAVVGILAGAWWGIGAAVIVLVISEATERIQRTRT